MRDKTILLKNDEIFFSTSSVAGEKCVYFAGTINAAAVPDINWMSYLLHFGHRIKDIEPRLGVTVSK